MVPGDSSLSDIQERIAAGDREAVARVLGPLLPRLVKLADRLLWGKPSAGDAEDAAQSAVRTYLRRAREGQFPDVDGADGLFRLLATITCRKALKQIRRRKNVVDETSLAGPTRAEGPPGTIEHLAAVLPKQEFDLVCQEWFELLPEGSLRSVALMSLYGHSQEEIAEAHGFTARNVRYKLDKIRRIWRRKLEAGDP